MRQINKIDIDKSISKEKLVFDENWSDKFNRLAVHLTSSLLIYLPINSMLNDHFQNTNEYFILYVLYPISILIGTYIIYRNATEKQLIKISVSLDRKEIRNILIKLSEKRQYEIYRKSNDCLIFNQSIGDSNTNYKKTIIFIIKDNTLLFTVLRDNVKLNIPTMFTHLFLKRDLSKLLSSSQS